MSNGALLALSLSAAFLGAGWGLFLVWWGLRHAERKIAAWGVFTYVLAGAAAAMCIEVLAG